MTKKRCRICLLFKFMTQLLDQRTINNIKKNHEVQPLTNQMLKDETGGKSLHKRI
jgi:hypothetical protein